MDVNGSHQPFKHRQRQGDKEGGREIPPRVMTRSTAWWERSRAPYSSATWMSNESRRSYLKGGKEW